VTPHAANVMPAQAGIQCPDCHASAGWHPVIPRDQAVIPRSGRVVIPRLDRGIHTPGAIT